MSESAAIRRAVRETAERLQLAEWREGAARLVEYYRTDPEVQEWQNAHFGTAEFLGPDDPDLAVNHPGRVQVQGNGAPPAAPATTPAAARARG